jgi:hypothetical protein
VLPGGLVTARRRGSEQAGSRLDRGCCLSSRSDALAQRRDARDRDRPLTSTVAAPGGSSGLTLAIRSLVVDQRGRRASCSFGCL